MTQHDYGSLANFLSTRFHEDWKLEAGTPSEVAEKFATEASSASVAAVLNDLDKILASAPDERELDILMASLGCRYDPIADGKSSRSWLEETRAILAGKVD
jgi:hypothetical protein